MCIIFILAAILDLSYTAPQIAHPRALQDDLNQFIALIPWADIIVLHDANDELIQIVVRLKSPEWHSVIDYIATHPTWIELKTWISAQSVYVDTIVNDIHNWTESLVIGPGSGPKTMRSYFDEVEAIIPWVDLFNLLIDRLAYSPEFQDFYNNLAAETTHQLVEDIRALPEVKRIVIILEGMGLRVQEVLYNIYAFLGWGEPLPSA